MQGLTNFGILGEAKFSGNGSKRADEARTSRRPAICEMPPFPRSICSQSTALKLCCFILAVLLTVQIRDTILSTGSSTALGGQKPCATQLLAAVTCPECPAVSPADTRTNPEKVAKKSELERLKSLQYRLDTVLDVTPRENMARLARLDIAHVDFPLHNRPDITVGVCKTHIQTDWVEPPHQRGRLGEVLSLLMGAKLIEVPMDGVAVEGPQPDLLVCLGYFYSKTLKDDREHRASKAPRSNESVVTRPFGKGGPMLPKDCPIVPHPEGKPFLVAFADEAYDRGEQTVYDVMVSPYSASHGHVEPSTGFTETPIIFSPVITMATMYGRPVTSVYDLKQKPNFNARRKFLDKMYFGVMMARCWRPDYETRDPLFRVAMFDYLNEYKRMAAPGLCRHNHIKHFEEQPKHWLLEDSNTHLFSQYKFVLVFENVRQDGWITEKVLNAMFAHSIPIFFGIRNFGDYLNPKRAIVCDVSDDDYTRISEGPEIANYSHYLSEAVRLQTEFRRMLKPCYDEIVRLDTDDAAYMKMISQPILKDDDISKSVFDPLRFLRQLNAVWNLTGSRLYHPSYGLPEGDGFS